MGLSHTSEDLWSFCPPAERRSLELGYREGGQPVSPRKQRQQELPRAFRDNNRKLREAFLGNSGPMMDTSTTLPGCQWAVVFL